MKMEYKVVRAAMLDEFMHSVTQHLNEGWELQGGLAVDRSGYGMYYMQAVVRVYTSSYSRMTRQASVSAVN